MFQSIFSALSRFFFSFFFNSASNNNENMLTHVRREKYFDNIPAKMSQKWSQNKKENDFVQILQKILIIKRDRQIIS